MSASPPDSTMTSFTPKRTSLACLNCRRRKIKCFSAQEANPCVFCVKKGYTCEYLAVSETPALSDSPRPGERGFQNRPPPTTPTTPPTAPLTNYSHGSRNCPSQSCGISHGTSPSHSGSSYYPQHKASQLKPVANDPSLFYKAHSIQSEFPVSGANTINNVGMQIQSQSSHTPAHVTSGWSTPQPASSDYDRYFANFGLKNTSYHLGMSPQVKSILGLRHFLTVS
ncbi:hypothetical protein DFH09DRAFT_1496699 [Mycena vulgaris]|nr:hypothetical protein DFH09DRAFT_1496699 [Mycena vulgaris]